MAALNVLTGALVLGGVWIALPVRWAPVDIVASLLGVLFVISGVALFAGAGSAEKIARAVATIALLIGMAVGTTLIVTAGSLAGLYGPVGGGGALILLAAFLLLVPYLVVFPASQLFLLRKR